MDSTTSASVRYRITRGGGTTPRSSAAPVRRQHENLLLWQPADPSTPPGPGPMARFRDAPLLVGASPLEHPAAQRRLSCLQLYSEPRPRTRSRFLQLLQTRPQTSEAISTINCSFAFS